MQRDIQDYIVKALNKLDQINTNLERIAKALESSNNQKISAQGEKKRLFESTANKKAPQKECTSSNDYTLPSNSKLVPDGYHLEYYFDPSKFSCSTETSVLTYSAENLEYKIN